MNATSSLRCELCQTPMTSDSPAHSAVRYYHCAGCGRWVASNYGEDLVKAHTARVESAESAESAEAAAAVRPDFDRIKARLGQWLQDLDERDPYFVLGVPPSASEETVRSRFKELALENHPDRGGDPAAMRRLILAYDRIRSGKRVSTPPTPVQSAGVKRTAAAQVATRRR